MSSPGAGTWTLRLELESHEHTNRVGINGQTVGYLPSQTWADMWKSAALPVPAELLRVGYNELSIEVGRVIPDCQIPGNAWDELLFRHVRLERGSTLAPLTPTPAPVAGGKAVTITIVFDNNTVRPGLEAAWGFASMVQYGEHTLLFDTGADGRMLLANMAALGFAPRDLDAIVLSHDHADHTGGLEALLKQNADVTVYLPQAFSASFKNRVRAYGTRVVEVIGPVEVAPGVWSTGQMGDSIAEQGLVVQATAGLVVMTGCAHPGIVEMVRQARDGIPSLREAGQGDISLVTGGFHLSGASMATIQRVASGLDELGVERVAPCHCTGADAVALLAATFGEGYQRCGVGLILQEGK